ncbi:rod shape-determining protein MreD [Lysobacter sp. N42]|nr:rod shape-determining protein MreD [Aliidiomarina sp. B3213]TCZ91788.1 rod shape-determining protein MreD [Lysobacter sp. N42]
MGQRFVIFMTFVVALVLATMPMSFWAAAIRPDWPLLVLLYWVIALPHRVSIGIAFILGISVDILIGSSFGIHAGAYALVSYSAARHYQRIRNFSLLQQSLLMAALVAVERIIVFLIEYYLNDAQFFGQYFWPVLSSAILWPWLFLILRKVRRRFQMI